MSSTSIEQEIQVLITSSIATLSVCNFLLSVSKILKELFHRQCSLYMVCFTFSLLLDSLICDYRNLLCCFWIVNLCFISSKEFCPQIIQRMHNKSLCTSNHLYCYCNLVLASILLNCIFCRNKQGLQLPCTVSERR